MKPIVCTKTEPADLSDQHHVFYHKDARPLLKPADRKVGDKETWHCPHCGLDFIVTVGPKKSLKQILEERDRNA